MPIYEFALVVNLPERALEPQAYVDAWNSADRHDATVQIVSDRQIELFFRRHAISENWAVRSATDDFTKVARAVRRTAGIRMETYEFKFLMGGEVIGHGTYEITDNKHEEGGDLANSQPVTEEMKDCIETLVDQVEEIDIDPEEPIDGDDK